jgi:hypothetical protein
LPERRRRYCRRAGQLFVTLGSYFGGIT